MLEHDKKTVHKRDFVTYSPEGSVTELYCKVCGVKIAGMALRSGPHINSIPQWKFSRNNFYAEIKIAFDDGSHHVTNGCKNCLSSNMDPELLAELFDVDMEDLGSVDKRNGKPTQVVVYDATGGGII